MVKSMNVFKKMKLKFKKMDAASIIALIVVGIYAFSLLFVLAWGFMTSCKPAAQLNNFVDYSAGYTSWPEQWLFVENYTNAFFSIKAIPLGSMQYVYMDQMMLNSFIYSVLMSIFSIATSLSVVYACAYYTFKLNKILYGTAIFVMLIPIVGALPSEMAVMEFLGLREPGLDLLGVCLLRCKYAGLYFLIFYAIFKGISWSYAESAQLDGAGDFQIFFRVMIPLARNTIFAVFILYFIQYWNDYYTPMVFLKSMPTIAYGLQQSQLANNPNRTSVPEQLAAAFWMCIPIIVVFIVFRNKIIGNVTMGGLKG